MKNHVVYDQAPVFLQWAGAQLGVQWDTRLARTVSHVRENDDGTHTILAVVVLSNWIKHSVELSIASSSEHWATRRYIRAVYDYVFSRAGKLRVTTVVEHDNDKSIELQKRLGHKYEGRLDDWFGQDRPGVIFGMTRRAYEQGKWASTRTTKREEPNELQGMEG